MSRSGFLLSCFLLPFTVLAQEPGLFKRSPPVSAKPQAPKAKKYANKPIPKPLFRTQFEQARGLSKYEIQTLHIQRVACARRIYSPTGWALNGEADLKVVGIVNDLFQIDFPSRVYLGDFNPYQNGVLEVQTEPFRQVMNFNQWQGDRTFRLQKTVTVTFADESRSPVTVPATDEVRVISETSPPTLIVRETIHTEKNFVLYFICR